MEHFFATKVRQEYAGLVAQLALELGGISSEISSNGCLVGEIDFRVNFPSEESKIEFSNKISDFISGI